MRWTPSGSVGACRAPSRRPARRPRSPGATTTSRRSSSVIWQPRRPDPPDDDASLLDDDRPLPRTDVERRRARSRARSGGVDRPTLPGRAHRRARRPAVAAMVREPRQAPSPLTEGLRTRLGSAAPACSASAIATDLLGHPKVGASWEGFVIEQLLATHRVERPWFWRTQAGAEIDLFSDHDGAADRNRDQTHRPTQGHALDAARARRSSPRMIVVIHAGDDEFDLAERIRAVPARNLLAS